MDSAEMSKTRYSISILGERIIPPGWVLRPDGYPNAHFHTWAKQMLLNRNQTLAQVWSDQPFMTSNPEYKIYADP